MALNTRIGDLATRIGTECKALRTFINGNAADLSALTTTAKSSLVAAINELRSLILPTDLSYNAATRLLSSSTGAGATLPLVTSTQAGLAPLSGGGTTNFLRADGTWAAPPGGGAAIVDTGSSTGSVWSSSKTSAEIAAATAALVASSPAALDTLNELATALGGDANFAATTAAALGNRVRWDAAQTLTTPQQAQACANIGVGDPETNFVTTFNAALV